MKGLQLAKMGYFKYQKIYHFNWLKNIRYINIAKFIRLPPIPQKSLLVILGYCWGSISLFWNLMNKEEFSVCLAFAIEFFRVTKHLMRRVLCKRTTASKCRRHDEIKNHHFQSWWQDYISECIKIPSGCRNEVKEVSTVSWIYHSQIRHNKKSTDQYADEYWCKDPQQNTSKLNSTTH